MAVDEHDDDVIAPRDGVPVAEDDEITADRADGIRERVAAQNMTSLILKLAFLCRL